MSVGLVIRRDRIAVAAMLARAFSQDAAFSFIFPDPEVRARQLPKLFALLIESDDRAGMVLATMGGEAASLWRGPGRAAVGWVEMLRHAVPMIDALRGATGRALAVANAIDAHMPAGDFWYLHVVGCDPVAQGSGWGRAVVRAGIDRAAGRLPVYLETATERNLGFYQALGFGVTAEWVAARGGPRFWSMLRPADQPIRGTNPGMRAA